LTSSFGFNAALTALHGSARPVTLNNSDKIDLVLQRIADIEQLIELIEH